jgi:hypothetical protein
VGVHPVRPGSHIERDGSTGGSELQRAAPRCLVPSWGLPLATWERIGDAVRFRWGLVKLVGSSPLPYQSAHRFRFQCSSLLREGKPAVQSNGNLLGRGQPASGHSFQASQVRRVVRGARTMGAYCQGEMRPARARSTGQRQLSMRCLVQGGQEQELSLGCGCWWSLAKSVASHVVVVVVVGWSGRWTVAVRCQRGDAVSPPRPGPSRPTTSWSLAAKDTNWPQFPMDAIRVSGRHRSWTPGRQSQRSEAR